MTSIYRYISEQFDLWHKSADRKPLLVRGARQIGKSFAVREWAHARFGPANVLELNFEEKPQLAEIFKSDLVIERILNEINLATGFNLREGEKLLFLDEIQDCPEAITALRYFYEKYPRLHVIGAGSLIEFVLKKISFPVGRIESVYMHPLNFYEFLGAVGKNHLVAFLKTAAFAERIPEVAHLELLHHLKLYYRIGGMPEAVWKYVTTQDMAQVSKVHTDLVAGFRDDFSKYGDDYDWSMLNTVFNKLPRVVGNTRVKYSQLDPDLPSAKIKLALSLFRYADLVHFVHSSSAATLPLSAQSRDTIFKLLFVDIGLLQHILGFDWGLVSATPELTTLCDGRFAEQFVGQEILATRPPQLHYQLHYWDREQQGSQAEVDYLIECQNRPAPIEIKSGTRGSLKSLTQYVKEFSPSDAFVLSQRNIERMDNVTFLPLYLAARL